jgi:hypothetical protein
MNHEQQARIESAFREVNEAIARTAGSIGADGADFICECADPTCAARVSVSLADYEEIRAGSMRFLIAPGHHKPSIERRRVGAIVRSLNPRAEPI